MSLRQGFNVGDLVMRGFRYRDRQTRSKTKRFQYCYSAIEDLLLTSLIKVLNAKESREQM